MPRSVTFRRVSLLAAAGLVAASSLLVVGSGVDSARAASSVPTFVQAVSAHKGGVASLGVTPGSVLGAGNRLVVEVGVWNASGATATSVSDASGDTFVELTHFQAADGTELSVWSAPVTVGAGARPVVTAKVASSADVGVAVAEYAGLSTVADASVVDVQAHAVGLSGSSAVAVGSGATAAVGSGNELAVGVYADSGFGDALGVGSGFTGRVNVSPTPDMELVVEDQVVGAGATPNATVVTGARTYWLMGTLVFKHA